MSTAPRLTIDLSALAENWRTMRDASGKAETSAVIKADAYGLGIEPVAQALTNAGCQTFFVAMAQEGLQVRKVSPGAKVYVLNGVVPENIDAISGNNLIPILSSIEQVEMWGNKANGKPSAIHVDTGMNRLGLSLQEAEELADDEPRLAPIKPNLVMSHLACADDPQHPKNLDQLQKFQKIAIQFNGLKASFANSAGTHLGEEFHFDLTRPGIALYGGEAINDVPNPMKRVVRAEARILQIRHAKRGETVGYGASHVLDRDTKIAICSAGYADGYHRSGSGSGTALRKTVSQGGFAAISGQKIPLLGRISMDLSAFDVTDLPDQVLEKNQWIELFGDTISVDDAARACGTIGYELLTSLGSRYQREYIGN